MSSITTRKILDSKSQFAGRGWHYEFRELNSKFEEKYCSSVVNSLQKRYAVITKKWTQERNSEWMCRIYMASKFVMMATIQVNSMNYAKGRNLRVVLPYLRYYAVLNLLRAICHTLPECAWDNGNLIKISHNRAIESAVSNFYGFDRGFSETLKKKVMKLKVERELISYKVPSSGDDQVQVKNSFLSLCIILAEAAQFNSEIFEDSLEKYADKNAFVFLSNYQSEIANIEIDGRYFGDKEDAYRLDYLTRKHPCPTSIQHMMTEGHVEDFFGSWSSEEENNESFNPDDLTGIIFDIP